MSEIHGHSDGIWRTFAVERFEGTDFVPNEVKEWLGEHCPHWSFQRYSVQEQEPAHISLRIEFPNMELIPQFREVLLKHRRILAETSWDEHISTKRAYEFGSKIFLLYLDYGKDIGSSPDNFLRLAFHGFFNDYHRDYREEVAFYLGAANCLIPHMINGLSIHHLAKKPEPKRKTKEARKL